MYYLKEEVKMAKATAQVRGQSPESDPKNCTAPTWCSKHLVLQFGAANRVNRTLLANVQCSGELRMEGDDMKAMHAPGSLWYAAFK